MITNRERLAAMLEVQRGRCFWCRGLIALAPRKGDDRTFTRRTGREIEVLFLGVATTYGVASVDHIIPRWRLGDGRESNLVAACVACNQDRGYMHSPVSVDPTGLDKWMRGNRRLKKWRFREQKCMTNLGDILTAAMEQ